MIATRVGESVVPFASGADRRGMRTPSWDGFPRGTEHVVDLHTQSNLFAPEGVGSPANTTPEKQSIDRRGLSVKGALHNRGVVGVSNSQELWMKLFEGSATDLRSVPSYVRVPPAAPSPPV
jgi:hypothetical protein